MKPKLISRPTPPLVMERKWGLFPLVLVSAIFAVLLFMSFNMGLISTRAFVSSVTQMTVQPQVPRPVGPVLEKNKTSSAPRLAYLVSGSKGDLDRLWRAVLALYHPRNQYVLHLDLESPAKERAELVRRVAEAPVFITVGNVHVIEKANMVTYKGPTMVSNTLHACAILLRKSKDWDWFINLSASDYPLVTQDDLLHTLSWVPRNLNFIEHTSRLGWKNERRAKPLVIDPGLYMNKKTDLFWATQMRELPTSFRLFTGSAWMALTRDFVEYCVWGWDNLPRTLLMYYTNFLSSPEGYFHTVICNSADFNSTLVNHDLHYISWDKPPRQHPHSLTVNDTAAMLGSGAPFARKFARNDPVLDKIDAELLGRKNGTFTPGGWCSDGPRCSVVGDAGKLKPGSGAQRMFRLVRMLLKTRKRYQCR